MTDLLIALAFALIVILGTLFLAFLGHVSACGLENLARKCKEDRASIGEAWNDMDDSREKRKSEQSGQ